MKNKVIGLLIGWTVVYSVVVGLFFHAASQPLNFVAIAAGAGLIVGGSLLAFQKPKTDTAGSTQQYIIATTVQILGALGFLLFAKFADQKSFASVAVHFLIAFMGGLFLQSYFLIKHVNRK